MKSKFFFNLYAFRILRRQHFRSTGGGNVLIFGLYRLMRSLKYKTLLVFCYLVMFAFICLIILNSKVHLLPLALDAGGVTTGAISTPFIMAIGIFMILPYYLSQLFRGFIQNNLLLSLIEGAFRLAIFFAYLILVSLIPDIKRTFMYHGAEHKCINCIEKGLPLTTENVRKSSRFHKRCGTSFLLIVMIVSILIFALIQVDNRMLRLLLRLALLPVVAGLSFEFIRLAGRTDNPVIGILSLPGLLLQRITTKEPDDQQIEVGMQSVEAVFDWKEFLEGNKT